MKALCVDDVRAILKKCNAPSHWGDYETKLLLDYLFFPASVDAVKITRTEKGITYYPPIHAKGKKIAIDRKVFCALHFAKMFAEAQDQLIDALPQIRNRLLRQFKNPKSCIVMHEAIGNEVSRIMKSNPNTSFWDDKAQALAPDLQTLYGVSITPKTIEHSREMIRKRVSPKTPTK